MPETPTAEDKKKQRLVKLRAQTKVFRQWLKDNPSDPITIAHKAKVKANVRANYETHPERRERRNQLANENRAKNPEPYRIANKKWRSTHKRIRTTEQRKRENEMECKRRSKNLEEYRTYQRTWQRSNRDKTTQYHYKWLAKNPDYVTAYNKTKKKRICDNRRKRCRERKQTDPTYRVLLALRRRIATALERAKTKKTLNTKPLLGCDIYSFIKYIESLWQSGMNWGNYGKAWHLDHIIPCAAFDLSKDEHKRYCFHFSNYQPLWTKLNLSKNAKLPANFNLNQHLSTPLSEAPTTNPNKAEIQRN